MNEQENHTNTKQGDTFLKPSFRHEVSNLKKSKLKKNCSVEGFEEVVNWAAEKHRAS